VLILDGSDLKIEDDTFPATQLVTRRRQIWLSSNYCLASIYYYNIPSLLYLHRRISRFIAKSHTKYFIHSPHIAACYSISLRIHAFD
jgi:hypothetical protein